MKLLKESLKKYFLVVGMFTTNHFGFGRCFFGKHFVPDFPNMEGQNM